jgi:hypothetical protein
MLEFSIAIASFVLHRLWLYLLWIAVGIFIAGKSWSVWFDPNGRTVSFEVRLNQILFPLHANVFIGALWNPPINLLDHDIFRKNQFLFVFTGLFYIALTIVIWPLRIFCNLLILGLQWAVMRFSEPVHIL